MTDSSGADWAARRRDAATEHAARLDRARSAEAEQAGQLLADFVRDARDRGLPAVALRARARNGRALYRTGLTGWYLKRNGSIAVDQDCRFYLMSAPTSTVARLRGTHLAPSDPPLVVGLGGRDGESMPLADLLAVRLASDETWDR